jgi:hypothetical protein
MLPMCSVRTKELVVEAAGVEPASEKARHAKTTCVSDSVFFVRPPLNRQDASGLARLISAYRLRAEVLGLSCKMTLTT